jgi:hypothetical protein
MLRYIVLAIMIRVQGQIDMPLCRPAIAMVGVAVIVTMGLYTASLPAAPAGVAVQQNATPFAQLSQDFAYRPACPYRYYYTCWSDRDGTKRCGCRPGLGFYLFRYN